MALAELVAQRRFLLRDYSPVPPAPGEIQVKVEAVGICGSDLHNFAEGAIGDTPCQYPMVLGHEPAGTVSAVGAGVTGWAPGDRAALEAAHYCYHCEFCMSGRHNLCHHVRFLSNVGEPGFFRDHVNLPATNLLPLPSNLGFVEATLFEPIGIILHSFRFGDPKLGESAAVIGAGPIGLTTIAALRIAGVSRIWCVEPVAHRRDLALVLGADAAIDPAQADPVREILRDTAGRGVDVVFDCAAKDGSINQAIHLGAPAARIVITGVPSELHPAIDFHHLRRKEQWFFPVRRSNHKSEHALRLLQEQGARFTPMLTHRMPLASVQQAFETLEAYSGGVGKVVVLP
ncbi:MAG: alcohol dehydrogenase catalytic domain-containing protein [Acidobacteria bacterium]|nr:alcohol dehydrogenase catalytic domain-containing protein [Acidobacteriota bacterium]